MANWYTKNAGNFWSKLKTAFWDATHYLWDDTIAPWDAVSNDPWHTKNDGGFSTPNRPDWQTDNAGSWQTKN